MLKKMQNTIFYFSGCINKLVELFLCKYLKIKNKEGLIWIEKSF